MLRNVLILSFFCLPGFVVADESEKVFSGPQPGEEVSSFALNGVRGDDAGQSVDIVAKAAGGPLLIVFFHEKTRPAFGLTNAVVRFAETRAEKGLTVGVVYLTADATETEKWLNAVNSMLPAKAILGISPDGQEGPGTWGLNRKVAVTVIVANEGKVTANFALRQPSLDVDGPKIFQAVADVTGGGPIPSVSEFTGGQRQAATDRKMNAKAAEGEATKLRQFLRPVIDLAASEDAVTAAAARVETEAERDPLFRKRVGQEASRIIEADKLADYRTPKAQEFLAKWAKEFADPPADKK